MLISLDTSYILVMISVHGWRGCHVHIALRSSYCLSLVASEFIWLFTGHRPK